MKDAIEQMASRQEGGRGRGRRSRSKSAQGCFLKFGGDSEKLVACGVRQVPKHDRRPGEAS
eukprot:7530530-Pyramimonas_sp.AAC.1